MTTINTDQYLADYNRQYGRRPQSFEDVAREAGAAGFSSDRYVYALNKAMNDSGGQAGDPLTKALLYGNPSIYPTANQAYTDTTPLRLQNLDRTLTAVLYKRKNFVLWDFLQKSPTINTLYEYDKIDSYGSGRGMGGFVEGGIPAITMPTYERDNTTVRYVGVQRGVSQQARMVGRAGGLMLNPMRQESMNGTMVLMERITRALYFGDSAITDDNGNTVNYTGILPQIATNDPSSVIDLKGAAPTFNIFENVALALNAQGFVSDFSNLRAFMSPQVLADLSKINLTATDNVRQIMVPNVPNGGYEMGQPLKGYKSNFGDIPFVPDVMMQEVPGNIPLYTSDPSSPSAPPSTALGVTSDTAAQFPGGVTYYYWVAAFNPAGECAAVQATGTAAPTSSQKVTVTITLGTTGFPGNGSPVGYRVYRTTLANPWSNGAWIDAAGGLVGHVPQPATGATVVFNDENLQIPGTGWIVILEGSKENLEVPLLTPLIKYTLPPIGTLEPFLLMIYHTVLVRARKRAFVIKNIGRISA